MGSWLKSARAWVDQIHLNDARRDQRQGRPVVVKRRRWAASGVMRLANAFFRLAKNPVEALASANAWRAWEVDCFLRLHGPEFGAGADASGTTWMHVLPGTSLDREFANGTLTPAMLDAAATELRRAHALPCPHYGGRWSHGDPHTGNFLFDSDTGRARLIDFEVRHLLSLPEDERHADDLLVLLQDVCGRCPAAAWPTLARAFLDAYGRPAITGKLKERLRIPSGVPRLWWAVRTTWLPQRELQRRIAELATIVDAFRRN